MSSYKLVAFDLDGTLLKNDQTVSPENTAAIAEMTAEGKYPDGGCSFETYTNECMLEFETLSELKVVHPGESNTLNEKWTLSKIDFDVDVKNDASIDNLIAKL